MTDEHAAEIPQDVQETAQEPQEGAQEPIESNVEDTARRMGWRPQEEFRGPAEKWVDADTFVRKTETDVPVLRERLRHYDRQIAEMQQAMRAQTEAMRAQAERAKQAQLRAIQEAKIKAVSEGDADAFRQLETRYEQLREAQIPVPQYQPPPPDRDPEFQSWAAQNSWYTQDQSMRAYADKIGELVKEQNPNLVGQDFLNAVTKEVKTRFADRFTPRASAPAVEGGRSLGRGPRKKGYSDLPAEAKAACDKFVRQGIITREQYASDFWGE